MTLNFIGEFLYHGAIDVEGLVAGSIQAHDDSAYDFNEDELEGVLLLWNIIIIIVTLLLIAFFVHCDLSPFGLSGELPLWRLLNY